MIQEVIFLLGNNHAKRNKLTTDKKPGFTTLTNHPLHLVSTPALLKFLQEHWSHHCTTSTYRKTKLFTKSIISYLLLLTKLIFINQFSRKLVRTHSHMKSSYLLPTLPQLQIPEANFSIFLHICFSLAGISVCL